MSNIKKKLNLAQKIKQARKSAGYSQKQLGKMLKLSDKAISSYEVGRATPPVETLREISKVTYKTVAYFMSDAPQASSSNDLQKKIALIEKELAEIKQYLVEVEKQEK